MLNNDGNLFLLQQNARNFYKDLFFVKDDANCELAQGWMLAKSTLL
jgi:hypothetical protein